jgi:hypothetical protein
MTNERGTLGAVRGVARMRERAFNFSAHFRVGPGVRIVLSNDCLYPYATRRITATQTAYDPQCEILRMRAKPTCVSNSA